VRIKLVRATVFGALLLAVLVFASCASAQGIGYSEKVEYEPK